MKTVLITGCFGGIGRSIVDLILEQSEEYKILGSDLAATNTVVDTDRYEYISRDDLFEYIRVSHSPKTDIFINASGVTRDTRLINMSEADYGDVITTNLQDPIMLSKSVLPYMYKQNWGRIINISSINGLKGAIGQCAYSATKAGLEGFTRSLALEVASKGITVNCVAPGYTNTPMTAKMKPEVLGGVIDSIPLKRMAEPIEIAKAIMFLIDSPYITGSTLRVDGGLSIK